MDDIVLERSPPTQILKLDDDEQALMNEIEITSRPSAPRRRPAAPPRRPDTQPQPEIDAFTNPVKRSRQQFQPRPPQFPEDDEEDEEEEDFPEAPGGGGGGYQQEQSPQEEVPSEGYTSIDDEKADLLNKLARLEKKGFAVNKGLNAYSDITQIRTEYKRIVYSIEAEQSIKFSRRMLIACVTGVEFLNKRYNPFDIMLEGWSESVMENVDDYDGVFEELYAKYRTKMHVAPEIKLIMMLGGSGMMFHLTHSMFKAAMPNMNDVMKQNPDLVKNMMEAVKNTQQRPDGARADPTQRPSSRGGGDGSSSRREMQGPGLDISSLMGGIMMPPPPPMNTKIQVLESVPELQGEGGEDDISDIVSISGESFGGDTKEVKVSAAKKRGGRKKKGTEVSM
jgi:Family of unknown function (DUF5767)